LGRIDRVKQSRSLVADQIRIEGIKETLQLLDAVQPGSIRELRKDIRRIAEPAVSAIRSNLPSSAPLSGMNHYGRTRFAGAKVNAQLDLRAHRLSNTHSLVRIQVISPGDAVGLEIADMAGRKMGMIGPSLPYQYKGRGRIGGSGRQSPTKSRSVVRRGNSRPFQYRINGQGKAMVENLGGVASRYVYPALAGKVNGIADDMLKTLESYSNRINQTLKVR
jgi:hypothetical protein